MITIFPHGTYTKGFTVKGHAHYAESGQDIVCSAVSVATQMIANEVQFKGYGEVRLDKAELNVYCDEWAESHVQELIEMMFRTLKEIKDQFPKHLQIEGDV